MTATLVAVLAVTTASADTAVARRPVALHWLQMVDDRHGYALGAGSDTYRVLATTDGGRTWSDITPGHGTFRATAPIAIRGATLLFSTRIGKHRFAVERSDDGGRSWRRSLPFSDAHGAPAPGTPGLVDLAHLYVAVNEGAAAGSSGQALFTSSDGGRSWRFVSRTGNSTSLTSLPFGCDKDGFGFATARRGFAGGFCAGGRPFFYRTDDGGRTWHGQRLPAPQRCACDTSAPTFFTAERGVITITGFAANGAGRPFLRILWTGDAGDHWQGTRIPAARTTRPVIVDRTTVWATGAAPGVTRSPFDRLFQSIDGGKHWQIRKLPFDGQNDQLDPVGRSVAFALDVVGGGHAIRTTRDGGRSWHTFHAFRAPSSAGP